MATKAQQAKAKVADRYMQEMMGAGTGVVGSHACYNALEHADLLKGIPIPSIALQYLINSPVWPTQIVSQSAGEPKTFKSTFGHQLAAWWLVAGGTVNILDTEDKQSGVVIRDMLVDARLKKEYNRRGQYLFLNITSVEQWQAVMVDGDKRRQNFKAIDTPPTLYLLDSYQGATSETAAEKLYEEGHVDAVSRDGQLTAKMNHGFMRNFSRMTQSYNVNLHVIHQQQQGDYGKTRGGGNSSEYKASLDLIFKKGGIGPYNASGSKVAAGKTGSNIQMIARFNSNGPDQDHQITVPVLSIICKDATGKKYRRQTYDWGAADAFFLWKRMKEIKDVLVMDGKMVQGRGLKCWSKTLGIAEKDAIEASVFGLIIQSMPDLMKSLRDELFIPEVPAVPESVYAVLDKEYLEKLEKKEAKAEEDRIAAEEEAKKPTPEPAVESAPVTVTPSEPIDFGTPAPEVV